MAVRKFHLSKQRLIELYWGDDLSTGEIGKLYGVRQQTVWNWLKKYEIERKPTGGRMKLKRINGVQHKLCKGPSHRDGVWLPTSEFHKDLRAKAAPIRSWCKTCDVEMKGGERYVSSAKYIRFLQNIIDRVGARDAARRADIPFGYFTELASGVHPKMQRRVARKILLAYREITEAQLVRHKDSIHHGAYLRGRKEKIPTERNDFYRQGGGDIEAEYRRERRRNPEIRERENAAHRANRQAKARLTDAA